ncbi:MAG: hypothetical protein CMC08_00380 [Flavobacteriaceae bacterium]|nr:hypothetical protein [Flavobacteriaceae bacterium]
MLIDSVAVILAVLGVILAYILYKKQRRDKAHVAFQFFQSSIPHLKWSMENTVGDLQEFSHSLDLENFISPVMSASLNDKFLQKVNLIHLNRFYKTERENKHDNFRQFLVDSNFFGDYHSYISQEINFLQTNYAASKSAPEAINSATTKQKLRTVLERDIEKFEQVLTNLNILLESENVDF